MCGLPSKISAKHGTRKHSSISEARCRSAGPECKAKVARVRSRSKRHRFCGGSCLVRRDDTEVFALCGIRHQEKAAPATVQELTRPIRCPENFALISIMLNMP